MLRACHQAISISARQFKRLWREEGGFLISTEWLFWATIVAICTIGAVMGLRFAARTVFVGVAADIAAEQKYEFKKPGYRHHKQMTTPHNAKPWFDELGDKPGKMWETPPQGESEKGKSGKGH